MRKKWTAVETSRDVFGLYVVCWSGTWLLCFLVFLVVREDILVSLDIINYMATLALLTRSGLFAIILGWLFAWLYLGAMRLTSILWHSNKLQRNIYANGVVILLCVLQIVSIEAVFGQQEISIVLPFVIANIVAGSITSRFLPKHAWFVSGNSD